MVSWKKSCILFHWNGFGIVSYVPFANTRTTYFKFEKQLVAFQMFQKRLSELLWYR